MIRFFLILSLLAAAGDCLSAQEQPAQEPEQPPQLRGWIFPVTEVGEIALTIAAGEDKEPKVIASATGGGVATSTAYQLLEANEARIELKSGERVLASTAAPLRPSAYYTLAAWQEAGGWRMKLFRDDAKREAAAARPVRAFNFAGKRSTVLSLQGRETTLSAGSVETLEAKPELSMVTAKVLAEDGSHPTVSSVEMDFSAVPSAYVVIGPDYRGRMRPRVLDGGPSPEIEESPIESQSAVPPGQP